MLTYLVYALGFAVMGLCVGVVARRNMPGGEGFGTTAHAVIGVVGAVLGGVAWLALVTGGWLAEGRADGGAPGYSHVEASHMLPGYWIGLVIALASAMFLLAAFKLVVSRDTLT